MKKADLSGLVPEELILENEPLSRHTSFRTGGPARLFINVRTAEELSAVLRRIREAGEKFFLLGRGTNVLADDAGFDGVIVCTAGGLDEVSVEGDRVVAGAGAPLYKAAAEAAEHGLTGLEFAAGIPGSVGGAMVMNAGAYGGEMKQVVESVDLFPVDADAETAEAREIRTVTGEEMEFGYRTSRLKRENAAALRTVFLLEPADPAGIYEKMEDLRRRRMEKQPLEFPSAGSTFKRPEGHFAGALIEQAGLRGYRIGDAQVSEKHCGFVINRGAATSGEVKELIRTVQEKVLENSGILLEREVIYL